MQRAKENKVKSQWIEAHTCLEEENAMRYYIQQRRLQTVKREKEISQKTWMDRRVYFKTTTTKTQTQTHSNSDWK